MDIDLAHLVQVRLEVRKRYSEPVVQKVPVVHLVQFGQNCSEFIDRSYDSVSGVFARCARTRIMVELPVAIH